MDLMGCRAQMGLRIALLLIFSVISTTVFAADTPSLLFYVSGEKGTTADFSAGGTPEPNFDSEVTRIPDGAKGAALSCGDLQRLAWWAPGNIALSRRADGVSCLPRRLCRAYELGHGFPAH